MAHRHLHLHVYRAGDKSPPVPSPKKKEEKKQQSGNRFVWEPDHIEQVNPTKDDWQESKHPRREDGKFGHGSVPSTPVKSSSGSVPSTKATLPSRSAPQIPDISKEERIRQFMKIDEHSTPPTSVQEESVRKYTDDKFKAVNDCMRNTKGDCKDAEDDAATHAKNLRQYIANNKMPMDTVLWRGLREARFDLKPGTVFVDHGFSSSTISPQIAQKFSGGGIVVKIETPKGTQAAPVAKYSKHIGEGEILFQHGTHYEVKHWDPETKVVTVRVVKQPKHGLLGRLFG